MHDTLSTDGLVLRQEQEAADHLRAQEEEARRLRAEPSGTRKPNLNERVVDAAIGRLAMELRGRKLTRGQRERLVGLAGARVKFSSILPDYATEVTE